MKHMAHWNEEVVQASVTALWEDTDYFHYTKRSCSECGRRPPADGAYPYCPYCGVEMENYNVDLLGGTM